MTKEEKVNQVLAEIRQHPYYQGTTSEAARELAERVVRNRERMEKEHEREGTQA